MALEPRRYDRILNEAPDDVLGAIFGFLLFEASTAAKDDDGVRAPLPQLLPQSPASAALGLPEHADLAKLRERAAQPVSAGRHSPETTPTGFVRELFLWSCGCWRYF